MKKPFAITILSILTVSIFSCLIGLSAWAAEPEKRIVKLPPADTDSGRPLMQVLKDRASSRDFSSEKLPMQTMSDLLWAAWGINRPDTGKRTAPSARNRQETDIYVATEDALYLYDAEGHTLIAVMEEDIRAYTGKQDFVKTAPVNLIYVADFAEIAGTGTEEKQFYAGADTGFISQNVYLYCTSAGLATVVRGYVDKPALEKKMGLGPDKKVTLCQSVGYHPANQ